MIFCMEERGILNTYMAVLVTIRYTEEMVITIYYMVKRVMTY